MQHDKLCSKCFGPIRLPPAWLGIIADSCWKPPCCTNDDFVTFDTKPQQSSLCCFRRATEPLRLTEQLTQVRPLAFAPRQSITTSMNIGGLMSTCKTVPHHPESLQLPIPEVPVLVPVGSLGSKTIHSTAFGPVPTVRQSRMRYLTKRHSAVRYVI